jgi:Na+/H+-dicarboxylate symporter
MLIHSLKNDSLTLPSINTHVIKCEHATSHQVKMHVPLNVNTLAVPVVNTSNIMGSMIVETHFLKCE